MLENDVRELAAEAIRELLSVDLRDHSQNGVGDYAMSDEAISLVRRARALGVGPLEPFEGYEYMSQTN